MKLLWGLFVLFICALSVLSICSLSVQFICGLSAPPFCVLSIHGLCVHCTCSTWFVVKFYGQQTSLRAKLLDLRELKIMLSIMLNVENNVIYCTCTRPWFFAHAMGLI